MQLAGCALLSLDADGPYRARVEQLALASEARAEGTWQARLLEAAEVAAAARQQEWIAVLARQDTAWEASCLSRGYEAEAAPRTRAVPICDGERWLVKRL